ncbi:MAG: hypothetical protein ACE5I1_25550, partial [bacterium]
ISVNFPEPIYHSLKRQAHALKTSVDEIVVQTVKQGLPIWVNMVSTQQEKELAKLNDLDSKNLRRIAQSKLSAKKQNKLDRLLEKNIASHLTSDEIEELDALQLEANLLTLKKAKALALLKSRNDKILLSNIT